jgi:hypothetical protein
MFGKWRARERRRNIRTRYLTPILLTPEAGPLADPLPGFLLELWDRGAAIVVGEPLTPEKSYVLRVSGEQGISDEPLCTVTRCRRADSSRFVVRLSFNEARVPLGAGVAA